MKISPARKSAYEILFKIDKERAYSSILLEQYEQNLATRDRALCHQLTLGVLRRKIYLDKTIESFTKKKVEKLDLEVLTSLRLGLYQLLFLDKIPAYSAINESVNLTKLAKKRSASGLVNAVLRNASKGRVSFEFTDETERVSVENSHPKWLVSRWADQFGFVEAEALAEANNTIPKLTFRFTKSFRLLDESKRTQILGELDEDHSISRSELIETCFVASKLTENLDKLAAENFIYFQEEASQLTASAIRLEPGQRFLDICGAPGSKITFIAAARGRDNFLVAGDLYKHRVDNLKNNALNQCAKDIGIVQYNAETPLPFADESFDIVLVDAPCSGTGTIRRNPEIRYSISEKDFVALADKQLNIVKNASKLIKRGGKLVYSTCSIEREENESVIEKFLSSADEFSVTRANIPDRFLTQEGFARTFPHRDHLDGFFIAEMKKS